MRKVSSSNFTRLSTRPLLVLHKAAKDCDGGRTHCSRFLRRQTGHDNEVQSRFTNKLFEQFKFSEEFKLDGLDDWMETSDISAPTSGKGIGLSNDGFGELEGKRSILR